jgi:hypothetical protein
MKRDDGKKKALKQLGEDVAEINKRLAKTRDAARAQLAEKKWKGAKPKGDPPRYKRVHPESSRKIIQEVTKTDNYWKIRIITHGPDAASSSVITLSALTLTASRQLADDELLMHHTCNDRCGEWARI